MKEELEKNNGIEVIEDIKKIMYVDYDDIISFSQSEKTKKIYNITLYPDAILKEIKFDEKSTKIISFYENFYRKDILIYRLLEENNVNLKKNQVFFIETNDGDIYCIGLSNIAIFNTSIFQYYQWDSFNCYKITDRVKTILEDFDCIHFQSRKEYDYNEAIKTINSLKKDNIFNKKKNLKIKIDLYVENAKYGKLIVDNGKYYLVSLKNSSDDDFFNELINVFNIPHKKSHITSGGVVRIKLFFLQKNI